jgi:hypothetical protein
VRNAPRALAVALLVAIASGTVVPRRADADWDSAKTFFAKNVKSGEWMQRRAAYQALCDQDRGEAVDAILASLSGGESHGVVLAAALDSISGFRSTTARASLIKAARDGKPTARLFAVAALKGHAAPEVDALLIELLAGSNAPVAAQAAVSLGVPGRAGAVPPLVAALAHKEWQVRVAAARSLAALVDPSAGKDLAARLAVETGRARGEVIAALERLSGKRWGDAPAKWAAWATGGDGDAVAEKAKAWPSAFGIPLYGERVVFVLDRSLKMSDAHPFDRPRLEALCAPPDGEKIPWFRLKSKLQFAQAQIRHAVEGFAPGTKLEVLFFAEDVQGVMGKRFAGANEATKKAVKDAFEGMQPDDGISLHEALTAAFDLAGAGDEKAWKAGPDEIVLVTNNMPTKGDVRDATAVAAAAGLKARLRMVTVHVVGIDNHPFDMAQTIARRSGGTYVDLTK